MFRFLRRWFVTKEKVEQIPYDGSVILYVALAWDCDICDHHNYTDYVQMEPEEKHLAEIREHNEQDGGGVAQVNVEDLTRWPYTVQCERCRHVYAVANFYVDLE